LQFSGRCSQKRGRIKAGSLVVLGRRTSKNGRSSGEGQVVKGKEAASLGAIGALAEAGRKPRATLIFSINFRL
jgi:hypothetical protein